MSDTALQVPLHLMLYAVQNLAGVHWPPQAHTMYMGHPNIWFFILRHRKHNVCFLQAASWSMATDAIDLTLRVMLPMGPCSQGDGPQPPAVGLTGNWPSSPPAHQPMMHYLISLQHYDCPSFLPAAAIASLPCRLALPCPVVSLTCCNVINHHRMRLLLHSITRAALCQVGGVCWSTTQLHHRTPFAWCQQRQQQQAGVQQHLRHAQLRC